SSGLDVFDPNLRVPMGRAIAGNVAETRQPMVVDDIFQVELANPTLRERGVRSMVSVPLISAGQVIGVLEASTTTPRRFTLDEVALSQLVGDRAALAIQNVRRFEFEHGMAETLQRSLLPDDLPRAPRLDAAARYLAGAAGADVGGDWYDLVPLGGGRMAV